MKQLTIYFLLGWTFAPLIKFVEKCVFSDWEFIKFLLVIISVDTFIGFVKAIKLRQLSSRGFSMVFRKFITYSMTLIATHVMVHFSVNNKQNAIFSWFDAVVFSAIIIRETISIFENIAVLDPKAFPKTILRYLKHFDSLTGRRLEESK